MEKVEIFPKKFRRTFVAGIPRNPLVHGRKSSARPMRKNLTKGVLREDETQIRIFTTRPSHQGKTKREKT
jgi:hypothetical protein